MEVVMAECCTHGAETRNGHSDAHGTIVTDPVCGMKVDTRTAQHRYDLDGTPYYFCSAGCRA
jgi:Cu+-exporting ATPase